MSSYPAEFDPVPIQRPSLTPVSTPVSAPVSMPVSTQNNPSFSVSTQTAAPQKQYKYFPAPPVITTYHQYQDVNNDSYLQQKETLYFLDKTLDWIKNDKSYKKLKKFEKYLKGPDGYEIMHKLLKLFVRRGNTNWYDLKVQQSLVKDYIKHKLSKL
jgi:hypothetical protein